MCGPIFVDLVIWRSIHSRVLAASVLSLLCFDEANDLRRATLHNLIRDNT